MTVELLLPALRGDSPLTIACWLKQAGDKIVAGEKLLEAFSTQFDWDIPAPRGGTLAAIRVAAGATANVGDVIAAMEDRAEKPQIPNPKIQPSRTRVSPIAARVAAEHDIDLAQVDGTGLGGRITKGDVLAHLKQIPNPKFQIPTQPTPESPNHSTTQPPNHLTTPQVTSFIEIDMQKVAAQRDTMQAVWQWREGFTLEYLPFIVQAAVAALRAAPIVNSAFTPNGIILKRHYDIAIGSGAVIRNAEQYNLVGLARRARAMVAAVTPDATFTIHDHSAGGALLATGSVPSSQGAVLNIGAVTPRAGVIGEAIQIRPMVFLSLTYDHRVLDGIIAAQFLSELKRRLEE